MSTRHFCKIQDKDTQFYQQFNLIICGLDSVGARRWINATLVSMATDGDVIPLIDGGTEGLRGQSRVIIPNVTSCYECSLDMLTPTTTYPVCTIANTPRLPEHCIEWASVLHWPKTFPDTKLDTDSPEHMMWLFQTAEKRAKEFGIDGVTYSLTQGVVKNIIPAIASTNAIIAASCTNEAFKIVTETAPHLQNYMMYVGTQGVYTYTFEHAKNPDCPVCGSLLLKIDASRTITLQELIDELANHPQILMKTLSVRTASKTLYMRAPQSLEEATRPNLSKTLDSLLDLNADLVVTDPAIGVHIDVRLILTD